MKSRLQYRQLTRAEIDKFGDLDRTETIEHIYYFRDGALILEEEHWDVPEWSPAQKRGWVAELKAVFDKGASFYGAFDEELLVGMSVVEHNFLKSGEQRLNLEGMWVSDQYRGQGIGKTLFQLAAAEARQRGANALYISATPSENTIRFYMRMGCRLTKVLDPQLYEREPKDIHLELSLVVSD